MGLHRWNGYSNYYEEATNSVVFVLENFCLDCHRGGIEPECPLDNEKVKCGTYDLFRQCINYLKNNEYLGDEELKQTLDEFVELAEQVIKSPWRSLTQEEREKWKEEHEEYSKALAPIFGRTEKFEELKELRDKILEKCS